MRVHIADTCKSSKWRPFDVNWEGFVIEKLQQPVITSEVFSVYKSLDKDEKQIYKDCGGYIFGSLQKDSRAKQNVVSRNALLLDLDYAPLNVWSELVRVFQSEMVLHSTHSHESSNPRFRLVVPLNRDCTPDEYECVARTFAAYINIDYFDRTTFQRNRLMYFPSRSQDGEWVFEWQRGEFLNVDAVLSMYEDWRDMRTWYYHKDERTPHESTGQKRQHPHEAAGLIGYFNKTFTIQQTIENFLSDVYVHADGDRYTFLRGSSAMGAVVYDDMWFYSHHATDPAQGRLLNAFELIACHLFADDIKKTTEFVSTIPEVRRTTVMDNFDNVEELSEEEVSAEWYGLLEVDKQGKVCPTDKNVRLIFENDDNLKSLFKYNELLNNVFLSRPVSWRKDIPEGGDIIRNMDYPCIRTYLGLKYALTNRAMIEETMQTMAYKSRYHPIRDYLSGLSWDGVPRVETAMQDYFGAEDTTYTREVFKKTMIGAVLRVLKPGIKHDTILVLVGQEGSAKSQFIKRLGMEWFSDTFDMQRDKAVFEQLQGKWIIEIGEIDRLTRAEVGQVKNFTSKSTDSFRPAYGHVVEDYPRQCIFIGTTNEDAFLKSETGNRRFYPVQVQNGMLERGLWKSKKYVYKDMDKYEVDQMWAETMHYVLQGEDNVLSKEATVIIDDAREDYEEQDTLSGEIDAKLLTLVPDNYEDMDLETAIKWWNYPELRTEGTKYMDNVTGVQLWVELLGRSRESYGKLQSLEMKSAMRKSHYIDTNTTERIYTKRYGRQRCYKLKNL
jgi:putative DNA primase/helicase